MASVHSQYDATRSRGAVIVLRRPWQRVVFMGGLFGSIVLLALFWILGL